MILLPIIEIIESRIKIEMNTSGSLNDDLQKGKFVERFKNQPNIITQRIEFSKRLYQTDHVPPTNQSCSSLKRMPSVEDSSITSPNRKTLHHTQVEWKILHEKLHKSKLEFY